MKVIYTPPPRPQPPQPPSWWRTFFKPTETIVEHDGAYWMIVKTYSWGEYGGRSWRQVSEEVIEELRAQGKIDE